MANEFCPHASLKHYDPNLARATRFSHTSRLSVHPPIVSVSLHNVTRRMCSSSSSVAPTLTCYCPQLLCLQNDCFPPKLEASCSQCLLPCNVTCISCMSMPNTPESYILNHPGHTKPLVRLSPTGYPSSAASCSFQCGHTSGQPYG